MSQDHQKALLSFFVRNEDGQGLSKRALDWIVPWKTLIDCKDLKILQQRLDAFPAFAQDDVRDLFLKEHTDLAPFCALFINYALSHLYPLIWVPGEAAFSRESESTCQALDRIIVSNHFLGPTMAAEEGSSENRTLIATHLYEPCRQILGFKDVLSPYVLRNVFGILTESITSHAANKDILRNSWIDVIASFFFSSQDVDLARAAFEIIYRLQPREHKLLWLQKLFRLGHLPAERSDGLAQELSEVSVKDFTHPYITDFLAKLHDPASVNACEIVAKAVKVHGIVYSNTVYNTEKKRGAPFNAPISFNARTVTIACSSEDDEVEETIEFWYSHVISCTLKPSTPHDKEVRLSLDHPALVLLKAAPRAANEIGWHIAFTFSNKNAVRVHNIVNTRCPSIAAKLPRSSQGLALHAPMTPHRMQQITEENGTARKASKYEHVGALAAQSPSSDEQSEVGPNDEAHKPSSDEKNKSKRDDDAESDLTNLSDPENAPRSAHKAISVEEGSKNESIALLRPATTITPRKSSKHVYGRKSSVKQLPPSPVALHQGHSDYTKTDKPLKTMLHKKEDVDEAELVDADPKLINAASEQVEKAKQMVNMLKQSTKAEATKKRSKIVQVEDDLDWDDLPPEPELTKKTSEKSKGQPNRAKKPRVSNQGKQDPNLLTTDRAKPGNTKSGKAEKMKRKNDIMSNHKLSSADARYPKIDVETGKFDQGGTVEEGSRFNNRRAAARQSRESTAAIVQAEEDPNSSQVAPIADSPEIAIPAVKITANTSSLKSIQAKTTEEAQKAQSLHQSMQKQKSAPVEEVEHILIPSSEDSTDQLMQDVIDYSGGFRPSPTLDKPLDPTNGGPYGCMHSESGQAGARTRLATPQQIGAPKAIHNVARIMQVPPKTTPLPLSKHQGTVMEFPQVKEKVVTNAKPRYSRYASEPPAGNLEEVIIPDRSSSDNETRHEQRFKAYNFPSRIDTSYLDEVDPAALATLHAGVKARHSILKKNPTVARRSGDFSYRKHLIRRTVHIADLKNVASGTLFGQQGAAPAFSADSSSDLYSYNEHTRPGRPLNKVNVAPRVSFATEERNLRGHRPPPAGESNKPANFFSRPAKRSLTAAGLGKKTTPSKKVKVDFDIQRIPNGEQIATDLLGIVQILLNKQSARQDAARHEAREAKIAMVNNVKEHLTEMQDSFTEVISKHEERANLLTEHRQQIAQQCDAAVKELSKSVGQMNAYMKKKAKTKPVEFRELYLWTIRVCTMGLSAYFNPFKLYSSLILRTVRQRDGRVVQKESA